MSRLIINDTEKGQPLWAKINKHLEDRLDTLRRQNDGDLTEVETARLRGCIQEVKALMGADEDPIEFIGGSGEDTE